MSKKLAIKGHSTRGKEVIELLEMMGGKAIAAKGHDETAIYVIPNNGIIDVRYTYKKRIDNYAIFTLEEFLEIYPFKIGDKVKDGYGNTITIKSMRWSEDYETMVYDFKEGVVVLAAEDLLKYNNKSSHTQSRHMYLFNPHDTVVVESCDKKQKWICEYKSYINNQLHFYKGTYVIGSNEEEYKKKIIYDSFYDVAQSDIIRIASSDERTILKRMIEKDNTTNHMPNVLAELLNHIKTTSKEELEREFKEIEEWSNVGPTVEEFMDFCNRVNKKPKYPTTYEECRALLHLQDSIVEGCCGYEWRLVSNFQKLLLCRDAYWKIAGEEMGLGKPWEPTSDSVYGITRCCGLVCDSYSCGKSSILEFPTEEMRDAFYENFKDLIEQCKELL